MNNFSDSDYYFDRNQNVCNISRTMYKGKSCWKRAFQLQMCLAIRTLISAGGRAAGILRAACVSFLDIHSEMTFAAALSAPWTFLYLGNH